MIIYSEILIYFKWNQHVFFFNFKIIRCLYFFIDEIRQDLENILFRMKPCKHETFEDEIVWCGWARMALPISENGCRIVAVAKPLVGELAPAEVKADISITIPQRMDIRLEWEGLLILL